MMPILPAQRLRQLDAHPAIRRANPSSSRRAHSRVDRLFWLLAVADEISRHAKDDPAPLVDAAARRVHATHRVPYRERQEAVRTIIANVVPLS